MKRDLEHLDLKQAFHPVPEACRRALMDAARSVREEKPVKRVSYRAALIAAVILLAAMAVAYAAVRLGWIEYFSTALPCPGRHRKRLRPASQRPVR